LKRAAVAGLGTLTALMPNREGVLPSVLAAEFPKVVTL
jgi:hypothetical protein